MLSIEGLEGRVGDLQLELSVAVHPGRATALVGPSGSGKTSILRLIAGLRSATAGSIRCGDRTWLDATSGLDLPPEARRCGFVFQDYALFGHLPAWRNVAHSLRGGNRRTRALEFLDRFGMAARADAMPRTLSGGERQRIALARALAAAPQVLLLDEPLAALDARTRAHSSRELAHTIADLAVPTLLVTHDFDEAATLADDIAVIDEGRVIQRGTPGDLASRPASAFVADLVGSVVLSGEAAAGPGGGTVIALDGGELVFSTDEGVSGPVAASVHPWEITLEPAGAGAPSSARNRVAARVISVTELGARARVGLEAGGQALAAEVTPAAIAELVLVPGRDVVAVWKASATRVVER